MQVNGKKILVNVFKVCIQENASEYQTRHIRSKLSSNPWITNTENLLALVDLKLLLMYKNNLKHKAIESSANPLFFEQVVLGEIEGLVGNENVYQEILIDMKLSIEKTVHIIRRKKINFQERSFLQSLCEELKLIASKKCLNLDIFDSRRISQQTILQMKT